MAQKIGHNLWMFPIFSPYFWPLWDQKAIKNTYYVSEKDFKREEFIFNTINSKCREKLEFFKEMCKP